MTVEQAEAEVEGWWPHAVVRCDVHGDMESAWAAIWESADAFSRGWRPDVMIDIYGDQETALRMAVAAVKASK